MPIKISTLSAYKSLSLSLTLITVLGGKLEEAQSAMLILMIQISASWFF